MSVKQGSESAFVVRGTLAGCLTGLGAGMYAEGWFFNSDASQRRVKATLVGG